MKITLLGIESSCDDTAAAIIQNGYLLSNRIADQQVHRQYGGVVPELASRAHQQNIVPVVSAALTEAGITVNDLQAISYTRGPGLMGALLVGSSFAKGLSLALNIPIIEVNHLHAHILSLFVTRYGDQKKFPSFPFLCLLVSGGHTQLVIMKSPLELEIIGQTIDDAAGEAFDKCAKLMDLPYPGGPLIDKHARDGNPEAFRFSRARVNGLDFSFSGLKTSFLYFLRDRLKSDPAFITRNREDLCASIQHAIVESLTQKLAEASQITGIKEIAIAGGVSANSGLRESVKVMGRESGWNVFFPEMDYATDNAAMIAVAGYYKYINNRFSSQHEVPVARHNGL
ncbi:MAG: tRNA (adenosine(37)-N6)-threonylcarbamoyltransferase complex transferase subunit TsaD [Bacteroidales bacterium]|nr:tRNA (adenosine(37)-N6)-threonylcarbamoyltransferase complex transferase subunit TsaD [Bacteroidales bacterium]